MKAGLKSDSLAPLHYFSVVHESIAWSSCSSAELASSLIHGDKVNTFLLESTTFKDQNVALRFGIYNFKMTRLVKSNQTMLFINTDISSFPFMCIRTFNIQDLISYLHTEITFLKYPFSVSTYKSKITSFDSQCYSFGLTWL